MTPRSWFAIRLLFFVSGAAGLVYEVVWSRLFKDLFGVSAYATAAVLATYLAGLALGGWVLGRIADRTRSPLRLYGLLELGIGASALAGLSVLGSFEPIHAWAANRLAPESALLLAIRCLLTALVILPPTFCMGGTLPAITRVFVRRIGGLGKELSFLYALNTTGAVLGSLAAGFVLLGGLGVHPTVWLAVAVNGLVGALSLALARSEAGAEPEVAPEVARDAPAEGPDDAGAAGDGGILVMMALSGLASLALEVMWTRVLVLIVGGSTYAFVTMLSAFLVGIALGSWLVRPFVDRLRHPRRFFGWLQVAIAASVLASIPLMGSVVSSAHAWFEQREVDWVALLCGRFGISFGLMIVPTTLIGATFPLASRLWARRASTLGRSLGQLYAANTLGNIAGAVLGGFVILPAFGLQRGIALLTLANLVAAGWGLLPAREGLRRPAAMARALAVAGGFWTCVALVVLWHPRPFTTDEEGPADPVLYYKEGLVSTVKVLRRAQDGRQLAMLVDGVRIGQSNEGVDKKQQVLAHFPFLLSPERPPSRVLTIGLGTGILTAEVAKHPGVEQVEAVELSPPVIEGARLFEAYNDRVLDNPRVRVVNDDGANYLRRSRARYGAIVSDGKSRSGHAGNAIFFSREYYQSALAHLDAGGVMVQWLPLDLPPDDLRTIARTFFGVFPYGYVWLAQESCFLVGLERPLTLDRAHLQRVLDAPETAHLRRHGWRSAYDVASMLVGDERSLAPWLGADRTVHTAERPVLEFYSLRAISLPAAERVSANLAALAAARRGELTTVRLTGFDPAALGASLDAVSRFFDGLAWMRRGEGAQVEMAAQLFDAALREDPEQGVLRQWIADELFGVGRNLDLRGDIGQGARFYDAALRAWPEFAEANVNLGRDLAIGGRLPEAIGQFRRALELDPELGSAHVLLGRALQLSGDEEGAAEHFRAALEIAPDQPEVRCDLGGALASLGRSADALAQYREALRLRPGWSLPASRMAELRAATASRPRTGEAHGGRI